MRAFEGMKGKSLDWMIPGAIRRRVFRERSKCQFPDVHQRLYIGVTYVTMLMYSYVQTR